MAGEYRVADPGSAALTLRLIAEKTPLPTTKPAPGQVVWANGGSTPVEILSQAGILLDLRRGAGECLGCPAESSTMPHQPL
jgi:hypothetical protein